MFEIASIREWRGHDVVDAEGHKIGELEAVYVDTSTDLPSFGTIQVGMPTCSSQASQASSRAAQV